MSKIEAPQFGVRRLVAGALVMVGAAGVAGCSGKGPNSKNYCAVPLGPDHTSLSSVVEDLSKHDGDFDGDAVLRDRRTGKVINLSTHNPNTAQQPGDVVVAHDVSLQACDAVGGQYFVDMSKAPTGMPPVAHNSGQE